MKQELPFAPIALCLLAVMAAAWAWQREPQPQTSPLSLAQPVTARTAALGNASRIVTRHSPRSNSPSRFNASSESNLLGPDRLPAHFRAPKLKTGDRANAGTNTLAHAEMLLRRAQHMIDDGPAFESAVQLRANLFGEPIVGAGTYSQAGQGSGQTRATLQFRMLDQLDSQPQQSLVSICDGRFIYRLHQNLIDGQRSLEFYDLTEIQRAGGSQRLIAAAIPIGPGQLMTGGVAGLLKQLSEQFEFTSIATDPTVSANQNVHTLRGTWKPPQLHRLLQNHPDSDNQRAKTWDQLPANLPHAVEIVLAETELAGLFPKRVIFYQFTTKRRVTKARPIVAFQFADPRPIPNHSPDLFVMKSDDLEATDVTQQYLSRLQANESNALR